MVSHALSDRIGGNFLKVIIMKTNLRLKFNKKSDFILCSYNWWKTQSIAVPIFVLRANFDLDKNILKFYCCYSRPICVWTWKSLLCMMLYLSHSPNSVIRNRGMRYDGWPSSTNPYAIHLRSITNGLQVNCRWINKLLNKIIVQKIIR